MMSEEFRPHEAPATWNGHEGKLMRTSKDMWVFEWEGTNCSHNISSIDNFGEEPQTTCTEKLKENCIGVNTIFGETVRRLWRNVMNRRAEEVRREQGYNSRPREVYRLDRYIPAEVAEAMQRDGKPHDEGGSRRHKSKQRKSRKSNKSKKRKSRKANRRR
jgi:hypothetical protein